MENFKKGTFIILDENEDTLALDLMLPESFLDEYEGDASETGSAQGWFEFDKKWTKRLEEFYGVQDKQKNAELLADSSYVNGDLYIGDAPNVQENYFWGDRCPMCGQAKESPNTYLSYTDFVKGYRLGRVTDEQRKVHELITKFANNIGTYGGSYDDNDVFYTRLTDLVNELVELTPEFHRPRRWQDYDEDIEQSNPDNNNWDDIFDELKAKGNGHYKQERAATIPTTPTTPTIPLYVKKEIEECVKANENPFNDLRKQMYQVWERFAAAGIDLYVEGTNVYDMWELIEGLACAAKVSFEDAMEKIGMAMDNHRKLSEDHYEDRMADDSVNGLAHTMYYESLLRDKVELSELSELSESIASIASISMEEAAENLERAAKSGYATTVQAPGEHDDMVTSPNHYMIDGLGIEVKDYIHAIVKKMVKAGYGDVAYDMGNVLKYASRFMDKNGLQDLKKAATYLQYSIEELEGKE